MPQVDPYAEDLALLLDRARAAGVIARENFGKDIPKWNKDGDAGPVTAADIAIDRMLRADLLEARPDYGWLSEETEDSTDRLTRDKVFIVDPIDGTRSFVEGSRTWAHSVAVAQNGEITAGAIYLPMRDLLYAAARGQGAFLNGERLRVSAASQFERAQILATRPVIAAEHWPNGVPSFERAHRPSLAYRLGLVGQGRFDAMLTFRPTWEWDVAAGALIVEEASGTCTDRTGGRLQFNNPVPQLNGMIAGGADIHGLVLRALGQV